MKWNWGHVRFSPEYLWMNPTPYWIKYLSHQIQTFEVFVKRIHISGILLRHGLLLQYLSTSGPEMDQYNLK